LVFRERCDVCVRRGERGEGERDVVGKMLELCGWQSGEPPVASLAGYKPVRVKRW
jgi:hypothetical protein